MKCCTEGCFGDYEDRAIVHTVRYRGEIVVIEGVPAQVCMFRGDVLLAPETVRKIETLLETRGAPARMAPLYEYA